MSDDSIYSALKKLREILVKQEKKKLVFVSFFAFVVALMELMVASIIVIFAQSLSDPTQATHYLSKLGFHDLSSSRAMVYMALGCGGIYLVRALIGVGEVFYRAFAIKGLQCRFQERLLKLYARLSYAVYLTRNAAYNVSVISGDVPQTFASGLSALFYILSEFLIFLFLVLATLWINPVLSSCVIGVSLILGLCIKKFILPKFYSWGERSQEATIGLGQNLLQFFHAFKELVLFRKRDFFVKEYARYAFMQGRVESLQEAAGETPRIALESLLVFIFVGVVSYMCYRHESPAEMIGVIGGYLYMGFRIMPGLNRIITYVNRLKSSIPSINRVHNEITLLNETENYVSVEGLSFEKSVSFEKVAFRYLNTEDDVLKGLSFSIHKGEIIGIVGKTGSGKSTLLDLFLGLTSPREGKILIDGKYFPHSMQWHEKIGYVPQTTYLTDDTIRANIAFGESEETIDDQRVELSCQAAQLEGLISKLPEKLNTVIGERGIRLSGGEKQRIAIARALYRQPEVLVFDEATSALDNETEKKLMETIKSVSKNRTVIMIAHRLTTLKDCDRIIVMKDGRVDKITTYEEL